MDAGAGWSGGRAGDRGVIVAGVGLASADQSVGLEPAATRASGGGAGSEIARWTAHEWPRIKKGR